MKPEFMRLRRAFAGTVAALLLAVGIVALSPALSASAHTHAVTASCAGGLTVDLKSYPEGTTVDITVDGVKVHDVTFGPGWSNWYKNIPWDSAVDHTYTVRVVSPDDTGFSRNYSFEKRETVTGCPPADNPKLSASAHGCVAYGTSAGIVSYSLSGVSSTYTIELRQNGAVIQTAQRGAGAAQFANVAPGTYTVKAKSSAGNVETQPFTVAECAPNTPAIQLVVEPCVTGGSLGAVTASLSNLNTGLTYRLALRADDGTVLETQDLQATSATLTSSFAKRGPGTYYVTVAIGNGSVLESSARATINDCTQVVTPKITVNLEPCTVPSNGLGLREITANLDDLAPSTVYTVELVTADAAATVISSTTTPGDAVTTFTHRFTGVPSPGDYKVVVSGSTAPLASDPITAALCDLVTLAPPELELIAPQCDNANSPTVLTANVINLDATKTYYVRIVDSQGATVSGGSDQSVTGSTTATVTFPAVPVPGTYSAQLLIDPGKQLAASSPSATDLTVCLPTLAMTGPGVLIPLGSVAALLLTLGGAVVTGRLRRRMAF